MFALVLPPCYLFGVMLVGLGARALYPPAMVNGVLTAHPAVGSFDQALIAALKNFGPTLFGPAGNFVVAAIMMAVIAAAMSTADANLHGMGAVLLFTPLPTLLLGGGGLPVSDGAAYLKRLFDIGFCGFVPNLAVSILVGRFTRKPALATVAEYARIVRGHAGNSQNGAK